MLEVIGIHKFYSIRNANVTRLSHPVFKREQHKYRNVLYIHSSRVHLLANSIHSTHYVSSRWNVGYRPNLSKTKSCFTPLPIALCSISCLFSWLLHSTGFWNRVPFLHAGTDVGVSWVNRTCGKHPIHSGRVANNKKLPQMWSGKINDWAWLYPVQTLLLISRAVEICVFVVTLP